MFNRILKFNKTIVMNKAVLLFASLLPLACSDYVGDYENEWKDPYGNEEAFKEMLNKFDWPWSPTCNTDDWIWCTVQKGEFMSQTEDGESWSQFTEGSVSLSFAGKDDKAYNFTTDLLPEDPTPILRRNGGLAVKLDKASGDFEAGVQVKSGDIANHSKLVVAYGNEYSEAYVSLCQPALRQQRRQGRRRMAQKTKRRFVRSPHRQIRRHGIRFRREKHLFVYQERREYNRICRQQKSICR